MNISLHDKGKKLVACAVWLGLKRSYMLVRQNLTCGYNALGGCVKKGSKCAYVIFEWDDLCCIHSFSLIYHIFTVLPCTWHSIHKEI